MSRREKDLESDEQDEVTEASIESFPASDPPAFNQAGHRDRSRPKDRTGDLESAADSSPASNPPTSPTSPEPQATAERAPESTAELRGRMPSGRTMGVSSAVEPSAAPFDTDDEAAGTRVSADAVRAAEEHEAVLSGSGARDRARRQVTVTGLLLTLIALAAIVGIVALMWILFI